MRRRLVLLSSLVVLPLVAAANEAKGPNRLFVPSATGISPVSQLLDAATLANAGRTAPDLLIAAARLAAEASPTPGTRSKKTEGARAAGAPNALVLDPQKLLQQAASTAPAGSDLAKYVANVQAIGLTPGKRGKTYPQTESVAPGATDIFEINFKANEAAQVGVVGLGGADLDLRVFDESWNEICASAGDSGREYCSWVPATTGMFRIRVRNQGKAPEDYVFATN